MSFFQELADRIVDFFDRKNKHITGTPAPNPGATQKKSRRRQVYMSTCQELPQWAKEMDSSQVIEVCMEHVVCKYVPHIEFKKIMSTKEGFDGNLESEYEGVAADCGAIKNFGMQIAKYDDMLQAYRYVNLEHIYKTCCGNPKLCYFFRAAEGEDFDLQRQQRELQKDQ